MLSGVTRGRMGTAPDDTLEGVTPDPKLFLWLNLEKTLDKTGEEGSGEETTAKKVISFRGR